MILPTLFFFIKIALTNLVPLPFFINFGINLPIYKKKKRLAGIFIGIVLAYGLTWEKLTSFLC